MQFRSARDEAERIAVAGCYDNVVNKLIQSGKWKEMPALEDMLPDERMPEAFFQYWSVPSPHGLDGHAYSGRTTAAVNVVYPLFILLDGKSAVLIDGKEGPLRVRVFPVFADKQAAEHYRKEKFPESKVVFISNEEGFVKTLNLIKEYAALVVFDPSLSRNKKAETIPVDEMLRQLRIHLELA